MKLHWSPRSPFVRKVMIVLNETGLVDRVECRRSVVAFAAEPNPEVLRDNPLGKIPTLVLDDGTALFDSRVICEYLDTLHDGPKLFPAEGGARFRQLRRLALADGLTDILLLWRTERTRPQGTWDVLLSSFETKVRACFEALEREASGRDTTEFGIGDIAIVCALGQMGLRFQGAAWQERFPALAAWNRELLARPSVAAVPVHDDAEPVADELSRSPFRFEAA